jgi:predicted MFS family arabinose efflux permease
MATGLANVESRGRQFDEYPSSIAKSIHQFCASAACPVLDHDTDEHGGVSPSAGRPLPASCVGIVAIAGGIAVANLYYNQPMLPDIGGSFGVSANVIGLLPMLTQIGYAIGLLLFVPLGDTTDRRRLVFALLAGIIVSLAGVASAPSLVWLDAASLTLGMTPVLAQVLVTFAAQLSPPQRRGRVVGTIQAGILAGILLARRFPEQ